MMIGVRVGGGGGVERRRVRARRGGEETIMIRVGGIGGTMMIPWIRDREGVSRLQEKKANIQMQVLQHRRMIEKRQI